MRYRTFPTALLVGALLFLVCGERAWAARTTQVSLNSEGWRLIGDLLLPDSQGKVPAVLLLHGAASNRHDYDELAEMLAARGIASLRLDLRGHGESTNQGRFVPYETDAQGQAVMIWGAEADVVAAHAYLEAHSQIDSDRIGILGASYSGEEMAEAGRIGGFAQAYVALSPGSFSDASIAAMDESGAPWFFLVARQERHLGEISEKVRTRTQSVEMLYVPGTRHVSRLLEARPDISERIAVWMAAHL